MSSPDNITEKPIEAIKSKSELYMWLLKQSSLDNRQDITNQPAFIIDEIRRWFYERLDSYDRAGIHPTLYQQDITELREMISGVVFTRHAERYVSSKHQSDPTLVFLRERDSLNLWRCLYPSENVREKYFDQSNLDIGTPDGVVIRVNHEKEEAEIHSVYEYTLLRLRRDFKKITTYYNKKLNQHNRFYSDHQRLFSEGFRLHLVHPDEKVTVDRLRRIDGKLENTFMMKRMKRHFLKEVTHKSITSEMEEIFEPYTGIFWRIPVLDKPGELLEIRDIFHMTYQRSDPRDEDEDEDEDDI
jgi:hypothetical protein